MEVRVRRAKPSDRDQLARLWEALWPETSAQEHARELEPILAGETPGNMPLSTWSQRPAMGDYSALLRSTCDRTPMAAVRRGRLVIWRAGMSPRRHGAAVSAANCFRQRKIGRGVTAALKWPRILRLTMNSRRPAAKLWALRLSTGASTIAKRFNLSLPIGNDKSACILP